MENSPAPGTPQTSHKAVIAGVGSAIMMFGTAWVMDVDPFTAKEAVSAGISSILLGGGLFGVTFVVPNRAKP